MLKITTQILTLASLSLLAVSCGSPEDVAGTDSEINARVSGTNENSWNDASRVNQHLGASQAVRINARTNYITFYENGRAVSKWKVATARAGKATPKGLFKVHQKEVCPSWNNGEGLSAGPCASNNPLGKKALWFHEGRIYGMHGVDQGHIASVTTSNPRERDQSSGCVRNHPSNIEFLYQKATVGMPVVVGLWDTDPAVKDCSGNGASCGSAAGGGSTSVNESGTLLPRSLPTWCAMNVSAGEGRARVRAQANSSSAIISELKRDSKVQVTKKVSGQAVSGSADWYLVNYSLGGAKEGYIHSSLLDCTR